ncbi:hypothetical protein DKY63_07215 [Pseudomonas putida]|uniref:Uncharacterized protein n=1 Tax=Pseudomonas putida TaxID=303 RepID=A0A2Z4REY1_PSEPU|nr:hypothetical protein DKY63_07215 [Pseudomonas putida]
MVVNDNAGSLIPRGVLWSIASRLAPTGASTDARVCRVVIFFATTWFDLFGFPAFAAGERNHCRSSS